jgi:hypothetical protein
VRSRTVDVVVCLFRLSCFLFELRSSDLPSKLKENKRRIDGELRVEGETR